MSEKKIFGQNKDLKGLSLESYIVDVTSSGENHCFHELLTHPHINTVKPRFSEMLKLFSEGSLSERKDFEKHFGALNEKQISTLKKLTILSEFRGNNKISISVLCKKIESNEEEVISTLLKMSIDGAITVKIDQENGWIMIQHSELRMCPIQKADVSIMKMKIDEIRDKNNEIAFRLAEVTKDQIKSLARLEGVRAYHDKLRNDI